MLGWVKILLMCDYANDLTILIQSFPSYYTAQCSHDRNNHNNISIMSVLL